jgi:isoquinoline 1-oxidoreductase subunit beta
MKISRRVFLATGAATTALVGGGLFVLSQPPRNPKVGAGASRAAFSQWIHIGVDNLVTMFSPIIDMGQGSNTALAQMLAEELDVSVSQILVEQAPAELDFANEFTMAYYADTVVPSEKIPSVMTQATRAIHVKAARQMQFQQTSGSTAVAGAGQFGMRVIGANTRVALISTAAQRWGVPVAEITTREGRVQHERSARTLTYGELALEAAKTPLRHDAPLKVRGQFKVIGQSVPRFDIPDKVTGKAQYGIDFALPNMRIATVRAAPARGGKLISVDPAPAMQVKGVEKIISLENAVVVIANGYWAASTAINALTPQFSDGGHAALSSASIFSAQDALLQKGEATEAIDATAADKALASAAGKSLKALYRVPFLHQAMMEPFALTAHFENGKLNVWGGAQEPLGFKAAIVELSKLPAENVVFHPMLMGAAFGRRFRRSSQIITQIVSVAMQVPYPVKLIWSREEDVTQGGYRPQVSAQIAGALDAQGKLAAVNVAYAQNLDATDAIKDLLIYDIPAKGQRFFEYSSNQQRAVWRSVDYSQHGFFVESFIDEMAHLAQADPLAFRLRHLPAGATKQRRVLEEVARRADWGKPLPPGRARGVSLVTTSSVVAQVIEASWPDPKSAPQVHRIVTVVDCGLLVNPNNAQAQIEGGALMGLSATLAEKITLQHGAVVQRNFSDYPLLRMAQTPVMETFFIASEAPPGGLGEMGVPPVAPALCNALFALTGKRIRTLPIIGGEALI